VNPSSQSILGISFSGIVLSDIWALSLVPSSQVRRKGRREGEGQEGREKVEG
jgi:hypothetical protein